jgi:hypothetical protein
MKMKRDRCRVVFTLVSNQANSESAQRVHEYYKQKKVLARKHRKLLSASVSISTDFDLHDQDPTPAPHIVETPEIIHRSGLFTPVQKISVQIEKNTQKVKSLIDSKKLSRYSSTFRECSDQSWGLNQMKASSRTLHRKASSMNQTDLESFVPIEKGNCLLGMKVRSHKLPITTCNLDFKYIPYSRQRKTNTTSKK